MIEIEEISEILKDSPSVEILRLRHRDLIIGFLILAFKKDKNSLSSENLHLQLSDYLEYNQLEKDDENEIDIFDTYEIKAKKYVRKWTDKGFLTNYKDDNGEVFYELSSHTHKSIDWISSLKKKEFVGAESKFKDIFNQLKELVEFTNEDIEKRIEILENRKTEIEHQIQKLQIGEDVKVFKEFEIIPRFNQLTQTAKELLSDFKEVEDNFKNITKDIYQKHADSNLKKSDVLSFTFDALDELKDSHQGKSFYAFWQFLMDRSLQEEWRNLTNELYETLDEKGIDSSDVFLKGMKNYLYLSGQKVSRANDKMSQKLSRIIRENNSNQKEIAEKLIQEIKLQLATISKLKRPPELSINIETDSIIDIPFEKRLTYEQKEDVIYDVNPTIAINDISESTQMDKVFKQHNVDKKLLKKRIKNILNEKSQTTLFEVIESNGGIEKGLPELFGYFGVVKDFTHNFNPDKQQEIIFDRENKKSIKIPEIILIK